MAQLLDLSAQNCSRDLSHMLARAAKINHYHEAEFDLSFSAMILAPLACDDPVSMWFQAYVNGAKIDVLKILEEHNVDWKILNDIAAFDPPSDSLMASYRMTTSASRFLDTARRFKESMNQGAEGGPMDVRHLMAVYIYAPGGHERDLRRWGFDGTDWSNAFLSQMRGMRPDELGFWERLHKDVFG
jgi:hypothetical protein